MANKKQTFPTLSKWLQDYCESNEAPYSNEILSLSELNNSIPFEQNWELVSDESFKERVEKIKVYSIISPDTVGPNDLNKEYWKYMAGNIETYSITTVWRSLELVMPAIKALNNKEFVSSAVLSRSLLEIACAYLKDANLIKDHLLGVASKAKRKSKLVITDSQLEKRVYKMIWGSRYKEFKKSVFKDNVLDSIDYISKNHNADHVREDYDFLCDIAHPSFIGNTKFWSHVEKTNPDGSELALVSRMVNVENNKVIIDKIISTLGWTSVAIKNAFHMVESSLENIRRAF